MQKSKKILKCILDEFIYGGHLLSLGAVSIIFTSAILLEIKITLDCLIAAYFATQGIYLYNRYKELEKDSATNPERVQYIKKKVKYIPSIIFCSMLIFFGILLYFQKIHALLFGILLIFLGFVYSIFLKEITKKITAFKNFFVSLCWSLMAIFLIFYYSFSPNLTLLLIIIFIFLRLFMHEVFSDIKDVKSEKKEGLLTLPIIFKKSELLNFLNLLNVVTGILIIFGVYFNLFSKYSLALLFVIPYSFYYLKKARKSEKNNEYLFSVFADGEFILWLPLILLGKFFL